MKIAHLAGFTRGRGLAKGIRGENGNAAVEFGLVGPLLALLLIGLTDVGHYAYQRLDMFSAVRAGAQYFMSGGSELAEARTIIEASWRQAPGDASVSVQRLCYCDSEPASCSANCPDDAPPEAYNHISAAGTFTGILTNFRAESVDVIRVR